MQIDSLPRDAANAASGSGTGYDALAWFYDRYWGPRFHEAARPALERLLYSTLAPGDRVVELCCGSGHLTQDLVARGYRVVGVDCSLEMLRHARQRAPRAGIVCGDIAALPLARSDAAAVVSTFDSINHLLARDAVAAAFRGAAAALRPGGVFVFDVNTEEAYRSEWGKSSAIAERDAALFVRGAWDADAFIGRTSITMFRCARSRGSRRSRRTGSQRDMRDRRTRPEGERVRDVRRSRGSAPTSSWRNAVTRRRIWRPRSKRQGSATLSSSRPTRPG